MKEYQVFVDERGAAEMYNIDHFVAAADQSGMIHNIASLWLAIDARGEEVMEIRNTGIDPISGNGTFVIKTRPAPDPVQEGRAPRPRRG